MPLLMLSADQAFHLLQDVQQLEISRSALLVRASGLSTDIDPWARREAHKCRVNAVEVENYIASLLRSEPC